MSNLFYSLFIEFNYSLTADLLVISWIERVNAYCSPILSLAYIFDRLYKNVICKLKDDIIYNQLPLYRTRI